MIISFPCLHSHIFITSFEQLLADYNNEEKKKKNGSVLQKRGWRRIIIDEGHNIRRHNGMRLRALKKLRTTARWSLTGASTYCHDSSAFLTDSGCTPSGTPVVSKLPDFSSQAEWLQLNKEEINTIKKTKAVVEDEALRKDCLSEFLLRRTFKILRITKQILPSDEMPVFCSHFCASAPAFSNSPQAHLSSHSSSDHAPCASAEASCDLDRCQSGHCT